MAFHQIPTEELRSACKQRLESCERWCRRIIHDCLRAHFGEKYFEDAKLHGQNIFNSSIQKHATNRMTANPGHYSRHIDTLLLDHLSSVLCGHDAYTQFFSSPFKHAFDNRASLQTILNRLVPIRNDLYHSNPITLHQAERIFCYSSDIINSLIQHYTELGMESQFNAPLFTKFSDSFGHVEYINSAKSHFDYSQQQPLYMGSILKLDVEIDAHFPSTEYVVKWIVSNIPRQEECYGPSFSFTLMPHHVGEIFTIQVTLTSNKDWHRLTTHDAYMTVSYKVLPVE